MNKSSIFIVGGITVALLGLLLWFVNTSSETKTKEDSKKYTSSNWEKKFSIESKDPLGLNLMKQLIDNHHSKPLELASKNLPETNQKTKNTYFFIGDYFVLKSTEFDSLLQQVEKGDEMFISCWEMGENMHEYFFDSEYYDWYYSSSIKVFSENNMYSFSNVYQNDTVVRRWKLFNESAIKDSLYYTMSQAMETPNFIQIQHGEGFIYLHSNPELFYNYQLLSKDGFKHASNLLSIFPDNNRVYWLELGNYYNLEYIYNDKGSGNEQENSLLTFIFKHKALLIAFLLIILGVILYFVFHSKRMQQLVPYIPPTKNRSVAFAQTMKEIYFQQSSPYNLLQVMKKNFFVAINKQFFIDLTGSDRAYKVKLLAEKASISEERILEILALFETNQAFSVSNDYLSVVSKKQRDFYLETGIIKHKLNEHLQTKTREIRYVLWLPSLLIVVGLVVILLGFGLLVTSFGVGIVAWPIGIIMVLLGIRMLSVPVLKIDKKSITFYSIFGSKKEVTFDEIIRTEQQQTNTNIVLKEGQKITVFHWNISSYDKQAFLQFINTWKIN